MCLGCCQTMMTDCVSQGYKVLKQAAVLLAEAVTFDSVRQVLGALRLCCCR